MNQGWIVLALVAAALLGALLPLRYKGPAAPHRPGKGGTKEEKS